MSIADMYIGGVAAGGDTTLRARPGQNQLSGPDLPMPPVSDAPANAPVVGAAPEAANPADDADASPATAPPKSKDEPPKEEPAKEPADGSSNGSTSSKDTEEPAAAADSDAKPDEDSSKPNGVKE
jgi:hypothetical protein